MKNIKKISKSMVVLIIAICLMLTSIIGLTIAYFTDSKSYTGTLEFGNVELDITGGVDETTKVINFDIDRKTNNDPTWTGNIMPGDTVKMQVNIGLKPTSEPAYYLAVITDTKGSFENGIYFSDGTEVYVNDGTKTYLQSDKAKTALTGDNLKYVGALTKDDTPHSFTIDAVVSKDYETQGGKTEVELHIYAIQQANLDAYNADKQDKSAYHLLTKKTDLVVNGVNSPSVENMRAVVTNYATLTNFGIVKTRNVPAGYTKDDALTTTLNKTGESPVLDDRSRGKISVYKKSDTEIVFASDYKIKAPVNCTNMFNGYEKATTIDVSNLDTSDTTNMQGMFKTIVGNAPKTALTKIIGLDNLNTSKVTDMSKMFQGCLALKTLDGINTWDTSNVTNMQAMFHYCKLVTNLDVSNFDTSNVTNMQQMFSTCDSLTSLNLLNFNTSNVTNMMRMFWGSPSLTNLNFSSFDTSKVTNMESMFYMCTALESLNVSSFDTSNVTNMGHMFYKCSSLTSLDVSNFDTSKVTNMEVMFSECNALTDINVSHFNTSKVTIMAGMFQLCDNLTSLDVSNFDTSNVTDMTYMFNMCSSLTNLDVSNFNTSKVTDMRYLFNRCLSLTSLDVSNFNTSNVTDMSYMFNKVGLNNSSTKMEIKGLANFDTSKVTNMSTMFQGCDSYVGTGKITNETLKGIQNWDVSKVTNMTTMFYGQGANLTELDLSKWDTSSCKSFNHMFADCFKLKKMDMTNWNVSSLRTCYNMFNDCHALESVGDISNWNTANLYDVGAMFTRCSSLTGKLDLSGWNTTKLQGLEETFLGCSGLTEIDLSGWDISNVVYVTDEIVLSKWGLPTGTKEVSETIYYEHSGDNKDKILANLFKDCTSLTKITVGSGWDTSKHDTTTFTNCGVSSVTSV